MYPCPTGNSNIVEVTGCERQGRIRLEPASVADLRFILHEYAADTGHPDLRHLRFHPEPACFEGSAEYAPSRTIYFGWEFIDAVIGQSLCGGGERLFHRIATVVAIIL